MPQKCVIAYLYDMICAMRLTPNDAICVMGYRFMTRDVIVSGNVHFGPIYRGIPIPLPRKFTMNNFNGQYITQNSRLLNGSRGSIIT